MRQRHPSIAVLGQTIRRHREGLGLSQDALAEQAGINRTYMGDIERGEYAVTVLVLFKIAKTLGTTSSELLADAESAYGDHKHC